ncbi:MAG: AAA family ATPase [Candidatus Woesearchaeota archaeon]|jgi:proteasome regulatory subunit|nr:AAA family ATPase [Candidatus Woesearchaeota archaeon]MDP7622981.1 AAA family ATPase [Candidatus Woesearchaeota archaeon]HJN56388.1 AAA family ATPase [Candidatus Woesearchaeota archaeon]|tara:strand:- start:22177 stop:23322 length:1146 start_codon:yes stop_codon:yes gene_type:complete
MTAKDKNIIDSVVYNYTSNTNQIEEENRILKETVSKLKEDLDRFKVPPLMVSEVRDVFGKNAVIRLPNGNQFYVNTSEDCEKVNPGDMVLSDQKNLTIIKKIPITQKFDVGNFVIIEKTKVSWNDVGGLNDQAREIKEVVELPLKKPELFKKVGITPPKGILLYGQPGTGKTLLAKAVAASTNSTFIQVVGSELVQKFIGEGAKMVKEIFELARKKAPAIIFIDEIDSLAAKRVEIGTSGEREVSRTFMQLLAEIDGFKPLGNIKVIGATNRKDILDPAIVRPGRLDRLIHIPIPKGDALLEILKIHCGSMKFSKDVDLKNISKLMEEMSGAEIKAVCTEAGYFAIREDRTVVRKEDIAEAIDKVKNEEKFEGTDYMNMFG